MRIYNKFLTNCQASGPARPLPSSCHCWLSSAVQPRVPVLNQNQGNTEGGETKTHRSKKGSGVFFGQPVFVWQVGTARKRIPTPFASQHRRSGTPRLTETTRQGDQHQPRNLQSVRHGVPDLRGRLQAARAVYPLRHCWAEPAAARGRRSSLGYFAAASSLARSRLSASRAASSSSSVISGDQP
jgi:hypothetical protein